MSATTTTTGTVLPPININKWVEEHRHELKPPVGNKYLYDGEDFFVMVIGGPNARNDFHVTASEEFFHQIKGDIVVRIREDDRVKDIPIREGETFFIPPNMPHSPQRPPDTIGLVVERVRQNIEKLGPYGRFMITPVCCMPWRVSLANIFAVREAVELYGRYPIQTRA